MWTKIKNALFAIFAICCIPTLFGIGLYLEDSKSKNTLEYKTEVIESYLPKQAAKPIFIDDTYTWFTFRVDNHKFLGKKNIGGNQRIIITFCEIKDVD